MYLRNKMGVLKLLGPVCRPLQCLQFWFFAKTLMTIMHSNISPSFLLFALLFLNGRTDHIQFLKWIATHSTLNIVKKVVDCTSSQHTFLFSIECSTNNYCCLRFFVWKLSTIDYTLNDWRNARRTCTVFPIFRTVLLPYCSIDHWGLWDSCVRSLNFSEMY